MNLLLNLSETVIKDILPLTSMVLLTRLLPTHLPVFYLPSSAKIFTNSLAKNQHSAKPTAHENH